jgi:hypothetical protein
VLPNATIALTCKRARSAANAGSLSLLPFAQRYSIANSDFDAADLFQALAERTQSVRVLIGRVGAENPDHRQRWLLRARRKWPRGNRAAEQRDEIAAFHAITLELLAEVPIAASLGRIRPIPAHVDRPRRRHSSGGHDGAQCDTVKDGPVVGLRDPRPHGPHDRGHFPGHSAAPAHCDVGPAGCDASMSKCDVSGFDRDASMPGCDVTSSGDASMPNRDVPGSDADADTSMSDCDMTDHRDTFT